MISKVKILNSSPWRYHQQTRRRRTCHTLNTCRCHQSQNTAALISLVSLSRKSLSHLSYTARFRFKTHRTKHSSDNKHCQSLSAQEEVRAAAPWLTAAAHLAILASRKWNGEGREEKLSTGKREVGMVWTSETTLRLTVGRYLPSYAAKTQGSFMRVPPGLRGLSNISFLAKHGDKVCNPQT